MLHAVPSLSAALPQAPARMRIAPTVPASVPAPYADRRRYKGDSLPAAPSLCPAAAFAMPGAQPGPVPQPAVTRTTCPPKAAS